MIEWLYKYWQTSVFSNYMCIKVNAINKKLKWNISLSLSLSLSLSPHTYRNHAHIQSQWSDLNTCVNKSDKSVRFVGCSGVHLNLFLKLLLIITLPRTVWDLHWVSTINLIHEHWLYKYQYIELMKYMKMWW